MMPVLSLNRPTPVVRAFRSAAIVVVLLAAAFFAIAAAEARRLRIDRKELVSPDLPEEFDGARLVFVADIHAGPHFGKRRVSALIEAENQLDADVLVLGGDYVGGRLDGAEAFYPQAARLRASLGRYAVLGNHDVWEDPDAARRGLEGAGITLLENESVRVSRNGESIVIAGVEDLYTGHPDAEVAGKDLKPSDFSVLVSHNPDVFGGQLPEMKGIWDLALSGHTHGGQVTFFGSLMPLTPEWFRKRFRSGWSYQSGVPVLVSNGVGTVTAPIRFFAEPEIHVITLHCGVHTA